MVPATVMKPLAPDPLLEPKSFCTARYGLFKKKAIMTYYSTRSGKSITEENEFYQRLVAILTDFSERNYFKEKLKLYHSSQENEYVNTKSTGNIGIRVYPFNSWSKVILPNNRTTG